MNRSCIAFPDILLASLVMLLTSQLRKTPWVKANLQTPKYARWNTFYCCACACAVHVFRNLNWIRVTIKHLTLNDCSPRDQSLSDLLYSKPKQKQNLKTALRFQPLRATAVNSELFPVWRHSFRNVAAHGIWRETVSLLDVMWPWTSQWKDAL